MMVFFRTRLGKILIWQKFSETRESDIKRSSYSEKFVDRCCKNFLNEFHVPKLVQITAVKKELILA